MLLRIAQGDAFACAVEYVKRKEHPELFETVEKFNAYHQHPTHLKLRPGMYSDDTQMSISVAEALIDAQEGCVLFPESLTHEGFVRRWFDTFKRDPRDGYSRGFQALLEGCKTWEELRLRLRPNSSKNGAAMRSVPIGVIRSASDVVTVAGLQASTTHATYGGINSSVTVALMSHFALYDRREFNCMLQWGLPYCAAFEHFRELWVGPVTDSGSLGVGMNTAHAVHTLLTTETSLMGIMRKVIEWGGDTDSVASIAWGIASARCQEELLPEFLERDLEAQGNLMYGSEFLKKLGTTLMETYK